MIDNSFVGKRRMSEIRKLSSEDRIKILSNWEEEGLDTDILAIEISRRINVTEEDVMVVLEYETEHLQGAEEGYVLYLNVLAEEIGNTYQTSNPELKGIGHISAETALAVLDCEDEIFWEIGLHVEMEGDDEE